LPFLIAQSCNASVATSVEIMRRISEFKFHDLYRCPMRPHAFYRHKRSHPSPFQSLVPAGGRRKPAYGFSYMPLCILGRDGAQDVAHHAHRWKSGLKNGFHTHIFTQIGDKTTRPEDIIGNGELVLQRGATTMWPVESGFNGDRCRFLSQGCFATRIHIRLLAEGNARRMARGNRDRSL